MRPSPAAVDNMSDAASDAASPTNRQSPRPRPKAASSRDAKIRKSIPGVSYRGFTNLASSMVGFAVMIATFSVSAVFQFVRLISYGIRTPLTTR